MANFSMLAFAEISSSSSQPAVETSEIVRYPFRLILYIVVFIFGTPGNCFILRVYWTKSHKTSTHVLIMALAWADLMVCLYMIVNIVKEALLFARSDHNGTIIFDFLEPFETTAIGTSIMVTGVIAADRYDCVCRPHRRFFTHIRGKIAIWASLLFSVFINIPQFIGGFPDSNIPSLNTIVLAFHVLLFVTVLVMIAVCYSLVYRAIKKHVKVGTVSTAQDEHGLELESNLSTKLTSTVSQTVESVFSSNRAGQPSSSSDKHVRMKMSGAPVLHGTSPYEKTRTTLTQRGDTSTGGRLPGSGTNARRARENQQRANAVLLQRKTTKMLFITSVVFLLTWLPYWISIVVSFAIEGGLNINPVVVRILDDLLLLLYSNNLLNPIIYGIANKRFRKDCRDMLRKIC